MSSKFYADLIESEKKDTERILCAAIWYKDLQTAFRLPVNIKSGIVVLGYRHPDCISMVLTLTGKRTVELADDGVGKTVQGFLTSKNRFLNRTEARELFIQNGGNPEFKELYSEDLY